MADLMNVQVIYKELKFIRENMVSREDFNSILESFEILHNENTVKQLKNSLKDIKEGKTKRVRSVKDIVV